MVLVDNENLALNERFCFMHMPLKKPEDLKMSVFMIALKDAGRKQGDCCLEFTKDKCGPFCTSRSYTCSAAGLLLLQCFQFREGN